jgi:hypothetical protein
MGEWRCSPAIHDLGSTQMEVSGQLHALAALPPGKESPAPIGQEA